MPDNPITVAIVEDDPSFVGQVRNLLKGEADLRVAGEHATGEDALQHGPQLKPDVVLIDLGLPGISGIECLRRLKYMLPVTQFIAHRRISRRAKHPGSFRGRLPDVCWHRWGQPEPAAAVGGHERIASMRRG